MKIVIIVLVICLISFYAMRLSYPKRWFKWDEWQDHIKTNHQKNNK